MPTVGSGGLLVGTAIADALSSGLRSYREERKYGNDLALRKKEMAANLFSKGLISREPEEEEQIRQQGLLQDDGQPKPNLGKPIGNGLYDMSSTRNAAAGKILQKLYPGSFQASDLEDLRPNDISNLFKAGRLKESIEGRRDIEREKLRGKKDLQANRGRGLLRKVESGSEYDPKTVERYQKVLINETKGLNEVIRGAGTIKNFVELAKTNPMASAGLPVLLARAIGEKGPLSNFDVQMWGGSKAVTSRLTRAANMLANGLLPEADLEFIQQLGTALNQAAIDRRDATEEDITNKYRANMGGELDDAHYLMTGRRKNEQKLEAPPKMIKVMHPDGRSGEIPETQWGEAEKQGYKRR